ncbi:MAG: trimeric autotransporter adhesin [Candidatus Parcubacteria bacterium]
MLVLVMMVVIGSVTVSEVNGYGSSSGTRVKDRASLIKPTPLVLGETITASTTKFVFNNDLRIGSTHSDVVELQKVLIAQGHLKIAAPTGYFGPLTFAAVKSYQAANPSIGYVTGFCGPLTRGVLNK